FWSHSKQHSSKTVLDAKEEKSKFWSHSKQHSSKTFIPYNITLIAFWSHSKQHSSKTSHSISFLKNHDFHKKFAQNFVITPFVHAKLQL
ncbi:hypothetical protein, partial [Dolosigranulum pigrum]|uniref:hypothetical protein n=1 Tax=Dolosigranulum pigrum TaxID=29394 RepID=UPI00403961DC